MTVKLNLKVVLKEPHGKYLGFYSFFWIPQPGDVFYLDDDHDKKYGVLYNIHYRSELVVVVEKLED